MKYSEIKDKFEKYQDVYVVEDIEKKKKKGWNSNYLKCLDDAEVENDREVIDFDIMTPSEATEKVFGSSGTDLNLIYEKNDKILFVKVENGYRYYNK